MGFFDKLVKVLKDFWDKITNNLPQTTGNTDSSSSSSESVSDGVDSNELFWDQRASFLFDNAGTRAMNALSTKATESWVKSLIKRQKANGDNTVWLFYSHQGDGQPVPTTMYKELFGGEVDSVRVTMMRERIKAYKNEGFKVVAWLTADDSDKISAASLATHKKFIEHVYKEFGDQINAYCVGLEMNEGGNDKRAGIAKKLIAHCKLITKKDVGVHLMTGTWEEAIIWGADTLYYQTGFGKSINQVKTECASVIAKINGRCKFVLAEYHKSSDSKEAKAIGQAAMTVAGCLGTGNGR
jgi:hypothetical protein